MRRFVFLLLLVVMVGAVNPAAAQQVITIESVQVQFWPEYDRPSMLVIYTVELAADVELPTNVTLKIPADVGAPNAVALAVDGRLLTAEYTREVVGEWAEIVVTTDSPVIHVEYYDQGLSFDGRDRTFDFTWLGAYAVGMLNVRVQVPPGATGWSFSESIGFPQPSSDGLDYYMVNLGAVDAGTPFNFSLAYTKSSNVLTVDALADPGSAEASTPVWVWFLIGGGVLLIGLGGWFFVKDSAKTSKKGSSKYARKRAGGSRTSRGGEKAAKFCHSCGNPALAGDKFCRECGEKLRV